MTNRLPSAEESRVLARMGRIASSRHMSEPNRSRYIDEDREDDDDMREDARESA